METPGPPGRTRESTPTRRRWAEGCALAPCLLGAAPFTYALLTWGFCPRGLAGQGEMGVAKGPSPRVETGNRSQPLGLCIAGTACLHCPVRLKPTESL